MRLRDRSRRPLDCPPDPSRSTAPGLGHVPRRGVSAFYLWSATVPAIAPAAAPIAAPFLASPSPVLLPIAAPAAPPTAAPASVPQAPRARKEAITAAPTIAFMSVMISSPASDLETTH